MPTKSRERVKVKQTGTREITGPSDDAIRSKVVSADLTIAEGPYAKGGFPIAAKLFGLKQLSGLTAVHTDRYWFSFEKDREDVGEPFDEENPLVTEENPAQGSLRVFQGAEVEDGKVLPELTTEVTVEGL
jgi:hypothetical protein